MGCLWSGRLNTEDVSAPSNILQVNIVTLELLQCADALTLEFLPSWPLYCNIEVDGCRLAFEMTSTAYQGARPDHVTRQGIPFLCGLRHADLAYLPVGSYLASSDQWPVTG